MKARKGNILEVTRESAATLFTADNSTRGLFFEREPERSIHGTQKRFSFLSHDFIERVGGTIHSLVTEDATGDCGEEEEETVSLDAATFDRSASSGSQILSEELEDEEEDTLSWDEITRDLSLSGQHGDLIDEGDEEQTLKCDLDDITVKFSTGA